MSKTQGQLVEEIIDLLADMNKAKHELAIARHRQEMFGRDYEQARRTAAMLYTRVDQIKRRGREALFELMLVTPPRKFLRFLEAHSHGG